MVDWYVDRGLGVLIDQVREMWPGITVGTIGDAAHAGGTSDHNPEADGSVDAADFMIGAKFTKADARRLVGLLAKHRDDRIAYIIYNEQILSSTVAPWTWRDYNGSDPHTNHVHVSVNDKHENDRRTWVLEERRTVTYEELVGFLPVLKQGDSDPVDDTNTYYVNRLQRLLNVLDDGDYGPQTAAAVKALGLDGKDGRTVDADVWRRVIALARVNPTPSKAKKSR